ncbi:lipoprotein [Catellatospora methionotrophica]|uniref:Lipoprotein n=1 Tax=Catellatospora methionotrophica TaxID=121620 RepID=A0A8J3PFW2_9ACTN|nr:hypothetical protein [Catellatospora methionotrophica]GIG14778.1 lipoprotein [Catellatospora methionotrophica]
MVRLGVRRRLRVWFDGTMDRGTPALIGWLGLASLVLITVVTGLAMLFAADDTARDGGWSAVLWRSVLRTLDPGTMGADGGSSFYLALMLLVTIGGIFLVSSLIGVLTTGLNDAITNLRKGRSQVTVQGHIVVLGWSDQVFTVVGELAAANRGSRRSTVVVLADRDKVEMEDQIRARVGDTGRTRVVCRSGSPLKRSDLDLVNLDTARAVMVLSPTGDDPDIDVIKVLLLLNNRPWPSARPHVVAAVQESANVAAAKLAAGKHALVIDADDIAVRMVVQSHRQSGLSTVCTDLLDFAGNEIYIRPEPTLAGRSYGDVLGAFEAGSPIGLRRADGTIAVNPPTDTVLGTGDEVILVAEDDLLIELAADPARVHADAIVLVPDTKVAPDRTLVVGWNSRADRVLDLLDRFAEPGSAVDVAAPLPPEEALAASRENLTVGYQRCQPTSRRDLERMELGGYQHIIVLSDDSAAPDHADDRTLVTLLHLRDIEVNLGEPYSIVTEMNDDGNREVAQVTKADDFVVSARLISLLMTQLAENRHLYEVFADLFDASGAEIHLKPAADYVQPGAEVTFATVVESARRRGESAIGYRSHDNADQPPFYGVMLNPRRSSLVRLDAGDSVIVIATD